MLVRSLFNYELLPLFRSARVAKFLFDKIEDQIKTKKDFFDLKDFHKEFIEIFEEVLINEGANSFRRSELLGTCENNRTAKKYITGNHIIAKEPILNFVKEFWELEGMHIYCKTSVRQEFSSISRDIHPLCILSLHFYDMYKNGWSQAYIDRVIENLDLNAISSTNKPTLAENHLHLNGAYPCEKSILEVINGARNSIPVKTNIPNADRETITLGSLREIFNIFGNFSRFLFYHEFHKNEKLKDIDDLNMLTSFSKKANNAFSDFRLSILEKSNTASFPLNALLSNEKLEPCRQFFYFLFFLWDKIFNEDEKTLDSAIAYMLIHILNLLRSYFIMSGSRGLEFFTNYFRSPIRKNKDDYITFENIFNSGINKLQFRLNQTDIKKVLTKSLLATEYFEHRNPEAKIKVNMVYHINKCKTNQSDFSLNEERKKIIKSCQELINFAKSTKSVCNLSDINLDKLSECTKSKIIKKELESDLLKKVFNNDCEDTNKKIDITKFLSGIDAAGNEENLPPEIYAPYMRELAQMHSAQISRSRPELNYPEIRPLRKVFHAGEDFEDIVTGMRRIDETIAFLSYSKNDRISHALALGLDPFLWYTKKSDIRISKINLLDNLVWLSYHAKKIGTEKAFAFIHRHEDYIHNLACELYCPAFKDSDLTLKNLYNTWFLRRNCPILWNKFINKRQIILLNESSQQRVPDIDKKFIEHEETVTSQLFRYYCSSKEFYKKANILEEIRAECSTYDIRNKKFKITNADIEIIRMIQDLKINEYADKEIIIEVCPSSNIYIGDFDSIDKHPIFRWNPPISNWLLKKYNSSGIRKNAINICINTDDPTIIPTNMENEFCLLRSAAIKMLSENENIRDIDSWINNLKRFNEEVFDSNYQNILIL